MGEYAIGQSVPRREDPRLLRGEGRYLDDVTLPRETRAVMVRSPHAHARIRSIDVRAAAQMPGVLAVLTHADWAADGLGTLPCDVPRKRRDGRPMYVPPRFPLADGRVRHVGQCVAMVVAETLAEARDAAERVAVEYEPLATVTEAAKARDAKALWDDCADNEALFHEAGNAKATDAAFARAAHVVRQRIAIPRIAANPIEPRGAIGAWDAGERRYTLHAGLQRPWLFRRNIACEILKVPETDLRVIAGDIGGSFGLRGSIYPEMVLVLFASRRVARPVKWVADRTEGFVADDHARDNLTDAELALNADGKFLALRVKTQANLGAMVSFRGAGPPTSNLGTLAGVYTFEAANVAVAGLLTNTGLTSPYRGAGRPEAALVVERMVDIAADELKLDPVELRRRNLIPPSAMPFKTALTFTYDSGRFADGLDKALHLADYAGFAARRKDSERRGLLRGIGVSYSIESAAGGEGMEGCEIRFDPSGTVTLLTGSISHGQGHETVLTQVLCDRLGLAPESVRVIQGDTDKVTFGVGTGGSRSMTMAGSAVVMASDKIVAKGRRIAAHLLEAAEADIAFADGTFTVAGTDRKVSLAEVARASYNPARLPKDIEIGLFERATYTANVSNFPNGCHVVEVEIDPDTGTTRIVRYSVVDDVGTVVNPLLLEGQIVGGIAQGVGEALMEELVYDREGQLVTGSFMDYTMPRAADFCDFAMEENPVPTPTNPLGVKGAGEGGTVGALPAVINAVVDALSARGVRHIDPPATPEKVWRALRDGRR
jgi:carbon-monoxide dehydrogenase large subunit